ncbi:MAG: M16 family metallopeptidase [Microcoleaceae cyanobacterium]
MTSTLLKLASVPPVNFPTLHQLPNGLTIVAEQLPVEAVNLNIWIKTGSAVESDEINGMAHFLEHMVFKGTPRLGSGEFEQRIEERGAVTNAATSQDYTQYYITTAPQDFAYLAPLQFDVVFNPSIPNDAFERERLVVLEEIRRSEDNPGRRSFRQAMETVFERLPYRRPVLGPTSVIEQVTAQQMRAFHAQHYQPESTTVAVVGNLPVEQLIETVTHAVEMTQPQAWQQIPEQTLSPWDLLPEPSFTEVVRRELVDESLQQARLVLTWRTPGLDQLLQTYALDILACILGQGRTARLVQDLREQRGLVSSISVSHMTQQLQGVFYISVRLSVENLAEVEARIIQHIRTLHHEWITEAEAVKIQTQVANRFVFGNETPSDRASLYGYYQMLVGSLAAALDYPARIQSITPEELQQAAQQYLSPEAYGVAILKPPA